VRGGGGAHPRDGRTGVIRLRLVWGAMRSAPPALLADEVHVVRLPLGDREEAGRALRDVLAAYLETSPEAIRILEGAHGKPELAGGELNFNLSHSGGAGLVAVSRERAVGVDVERIDSRRDALALAERALGAEGAAAVQAAPVSDRTAVFHRAWFRREGRGEMRGHGTLDPAAGHPAPGDRPRRRRGLRGRPRRGRRGARAGGAAAVSPVDPQLVERFAELIVGFGANVQPGQVVGVGAEPGKEQLARAIAGAAYRAGAKFVDVSLLRHARQTRTDPARARGHARVRAALVRPAGARVRRAARRAHRVDGRRCAGRARRLDPVRAGRDQLPAVKEVAEVVNQQTTNWTAAPCPTPAWAALVHPELDPDAALERLWEQIAHVCRLGRARPGGGLGRAHADPAVGGRTPDRAALRRDPVPRARHRFARRAAPGLALAGRPLRDRRRDRAPAQPALGGNDVTQLTAARNAEFLSVASLARRLEHYSDLLSPMVSPASGCRPLRIGPRRPRELPLRLREVPDDAAKTPQNIAATITSIVVTSELRGPCESNIVIQMCPDSFLILPPEALTLRARAPTSEHPPNRAPRGHNRNSKSPVHKPGSLYCPYGGLPAGFVRRKSLSAAGAKI